jgi:hypothetical protein
VLKSYIMVLPDSPVPGKALPELPDEQMQALARFTREHGLKVAFEVGGVRGAEGVADDQLGEVTAASELTHLRRWVRAGGTIDYLTVDHAVTLNAGTQYVSPGQPGERRLTIDQGIHELVDYFEIMHRELPGTRFGDIESLGYFEVEGLNGKHYSRTVPMLPPWDFGEYLDKLLAAMKERGLTLDHFHIDFGYEGVQHDGGGQGKLDCGRVLAVVEAAQARGLRAGVIVNAFHDQSVKDPESLAASRSAIEHTRRYLEAYLAAGGKADTLVLQTWMPYPDRTGPETDPDTVLGMDRMLLGMIDGTATE